MAGIVNLNRFRKEKARSARRAAADANAAKHGRTRAEREHEAAEADRAARALEAHRRAPAEEPPDPAQE